MFLSGTGYKNTNQRNQKKKKISEYVIDETVKVGSEYIWIWVAIELESKEILGISVSKVLCCITKPLYLGSNQLII